MAKVALGDRVIWATSFDDPTSIRGGVVTKLGSDVAWVDEDCVYQAYLFPASVREELAQILTERMKLKRAYDDSMKLIYELRNAITRGER